MKRRPKKHLTAVNISARDCARSTYGAATLTWARAAISTTKTLPACQAPGESARRLSKKASRNCRVMFTR